MRNTILLILFSIPAFGQVNIIVLDSVNQNGLENAVIRYNDQFTLTKGDGKAMLSTNLPLTIRVNLIGYCNRQATITEENQRIYLNPNPLSLDEVVVTGQYSPQSAKNSVYKVRTITNQRIQAQVEPVKEKWDLMYSTYCGAANYGVFLAIAYNDIVVQIVPISVQ